MITLQDILQQKEEVTKAVISIRSELAFYEGKHQCLLELEKFLTMKLDAASKGLPPPQIKTVVPQVGVKPVPPPPTPTPTPTPDSNAVPTEPK